MRGPGRGARPRRSVRTSPDGCIHTRAADAVRPQWQTVIDDHIEWRKAQGMLWLWNGDLRSGAGTGRHVTPKRYPGLIIGSSEQRHLDGPVYVDA
jgi:hypothetical protein